MCGHEKFMAALDLLSFRFVSAFCALGSKRGSLSRAATRRLQPAASKLERQVAAMGGPTLTSVSAPVVDKAKAAQIWLWWSKPMGSHFGVGEFTHFRTYVSGAWDLMGGLLMGRKKRFSFRGALRTLLRRLRAQLGA